MYVCASVCAITIFGSGDIINQIINAHLTDVKHQVISKMKATRKVKLYAHMRAYIGINVYSTRYILIYENIDTAFIKRAANPGGCDVIWASL